VHLLFFLFYCSLCSNNNKDDSNEGNTDKGHEDSSLGAPHLVILFLLMFSAVMRIIVTTVRTTRATLTEHMRTAAQMHLLVF
jgi:hypothetical protein